MNRISLWLRAMPSARFTLMDRCASSRSRCLRTASAFAAGNDSVFSCPPMDEMLARGGDQARHHVDRLVLVKALRLGEVLPGAEGEGVADRGAGALGGVAAEATAAKEDVGGERQELVVGGKLLGDDRHRLFVA